MIGKKFFKNLNYTRPRGTIIMTEFIKLKFFRINVQNQSNHAENHD